MSDVHLRQTASEPPLGHVHGAFLWWYQPCGLDCGFRPFSLCAGDETRSLCMLAKCPASELHPQTMVSIFAAP